METYLYVAKDLVTQKKMKGEMEGDNAKQIRKILIEKNLYPISVKQKTLLNSEVTWLQPKVKLTAINFFCKQFVAMLQAGISIAKSLEICAAQTSDKHLAKHIRHLYLEVSAGKTLSQAVEEEKIFPDILVSLIVCGEASGNLEEVIKRAIEHFDTQLERRKKVKKALTYPILVLGVTVVAVIILMVNVVPAYMTLLNDAGAELPMPTRIVMAVSHLIVTQGSMLVALLIGLGVCLIYIRRIPRVKYGLSWLSLYIPFAGTLNKKRLAATFSSTMSLLVRSGLPILQAMEMTKHVMSNEVAKVKINGAIEKLKQGKSLSAVLSKGDIYPDLLVSMISIGEESGSLDEMLVKISEFYKDEVERVVDYLITFIEPAMIIGVGIIVGGIMAAIVLPTFSAASAIL